MFTKKKLTAWVFCLTLFVSELLHSEAPSVLVIGHGFMGANHVKNLEILQREDAVRIVGVVDINESKLSNLGYPTFLTTEEALCHLSPDIVVVAPNTKEHFNVVKTVLSTDKKPALFVEKPLVETSKQVDELTSWLKDQQIPITCGYLFRHSPIVEQAIGYLKTHHLKIEDIQVRWQKKRVPTRPSAGVHIDEATHPVDLILNQLLPALDMPNRPISLVCTSRKYDDSIIDRSQQALLYRDNPQKLVPLAEVAFEIHTPEVNIHVFSSFLQPPQIREITLYCSSDTKIQLNFDKDQTDQLEIFSPFGFQKSVLEKPNKLLLEWRAFLDYYHTGHLHPTLASLNDMRDDILITEMLDEIPLNRDTLCIENFSH